MLVAFEDLHNSVLRVSALLQELMVEHGMRIACVAACNFDCLHQLLTSSMETGLPAGPTFADKWRIVAVRPRLLLPSTFITPYPSRTCVNKLSLGILFALKFTPDSELQCRCTRHAGLVAMPSDVTFGSLVCPPMSCPLW